MKNYCDGFFEVFWEEISTPIQHIGGWVGIPSGPGLGVEVDRAVLDKFRV